MTKEENDMLKRAIESHINLLYRSADAYCDQGNKEALADCYTEIRKYQALKESLMRK